MGKAKIVAHISKSEYSVIYFHDMTVVTKKLEKINADILKIEAEITKKNISISQEKTNLDIVNGDLEPLIISFQSCSNIDPITTFERCSVQRKKMQVATIDYLIKSREIDDLVWRRDDALFTKQKLIKEKVLYEGLTGEEAMDIWCVDLCDRKPSDPDFGLWLNHGEVLAVNAIVGTIEIFDHSTHKYNIYIVPSSYNSNPDYDQGIHGISGSTLSNNGSAFVYNFNMRGATDTWHPTFRLAIINSITEDGIAQITYNALKDDDGVKFNTIDHLNDNNVIVDYMLCPTNTPFLAGDQVIIAFAGNLMSSPRIIGYHKNPKACKGVLNIHFNPVYGRYGGGWGEPFHDVSNLPINAPYGSAYADNETKTHNDRNKIAELRESGSTVNFGAQLNPFPANNYFHGENGCVGWWGLGSSMSLNYGGWANSDCFNSVVGDIVRIWVGDTNPRDFNFEYWILTHNKDGTGYNAALEDDGKTNFSAYFGYEKLYDHTSVFINGETEPLTVGATIGSYGLFIAGCSIGSDPITGFWLFYITTNLTFDGDINDETLYAKKLNDGTYITLGSYSALMLNAVDKNKGKVFFSQNGLKFITRRQNSNGANVDIPADYDDDTMDMVRGEISFDEFGIPSAIIATQSLGSLDDFDTKNGQETMIGFKENTESITRTYPSGSGSVPWLDVLFFDAQHDIFVGRMIDDVAGSFSGWSYTDLYVQIGGKLYVYAYDIANGIYTIETNTSIATNIGFITCAEVKDSFSTGSFIATEHGLFMSIGASDHHEYQYDNEATNTPQNSNNVFIATNGTVTDLSELWLKEPNGDPSLSPDPLLRVRPLGLSIGSHHSYNVTPLGGISVGGNAIIPRTFKVIGSGSVMINGKSTTTPKGFDVVGSGSVYISGTAMTNKI